VRQFAGHWYSGRAARLCAVEGMLVGLALWVTGRHAAGNLRALAALIGAAACVPAALYLADLYDPQVMRNDRARGSATLKALGFAALFAAIIGVLGGGGLPKGALIGTFGVASLGVLLARAALVTRTDEDAHSRVLILGAGARATETARLIRTQAFGEYQVAGTLDPKLDLGSAADNDDVLRAVAGVEPAQSPPLVTVATESQPAEVALAPVPAVAAPSHDDANVCNAATSCRPRPGRPQRESWRLEARRKTPARRSLRGFSSLGEYNGNSWRVCCVALSDAAIRKVRCLALRLSAAVTGGFGEIGGVLQKFEDHGAERLEVLVVAGSLITLLEYDAELPLGQDEVVVEVVDLPAGNVGVVRDEPIPGRHPIQIALAPTRSRVAAGVSGPGVQRPAEIQLGIAHRPHLPVDDRGELGWGAVAEHHVRELVIAVHEPRHVVDRPMPSKPVGGHVETGKVASLDLLEERSPALDLAFVEAVGPAQAFQPAVSPVHVSQQCGGFDQLEG